MKIRYRRTGGLANIAKEMEIDSRELPGNFQNLLLMIRSATFLEPVHSDDFFHELELEDGRKIRCTDSQCPQELLELFDFLTQIRKEAK